MKDLLGHDPDRASQAEIDDLMARFKAIERPARGFRLILADPPWLIKMRSAKGEGKSPQAHYKCLEIGVIAAMPVWKLAATDSILLLWGTAPLLMRQLEVMKSWGFNYVSFAPWFKGSQLSAGDDPDDDLWNPSFGGGYLFRNCSEIMLIGTRGQPLLKDERRSVRGAFFGPLREHSRKPDEQYSHAEALSPGPYLEIFSRTDRPGWTHFGDQVGKFGESNAEEKSTKSP